MFQHTSVGLGNDAWHMLGAGVEHEVEVVGRLAGLGLRIHHLRVHLDHEPRVHGVHNLGRWNNITDLMPMINTMKLFVFVGI